MSYLVNTNTKIKKIDKRILDCLRMDDQWNYFKLAEKMLFSCQRKKARKESFVNSFEGIMLNCLVPYLIETNTIRGLENSLLELDFENYSKFNFH